MGRRSKEDILLMIKINQLVLFQKILGLPVTDVSKIFREYKILEYIDKCYWSFHVQGDLATFVDIYEELRKADGRKFRRIDNVY
jgi:hypothetical protein